MGVDTAFDGWGTALILGVIFTIGLAIIRRRRDLRVASRTAEYDLWRNLKWLAFSDWQRRNPESLPRDPQFGSPGLFVQYAPILIDRRPDLANTLLFVYAWTEFVRSDPAWAMADDDRIDLTAAAQRLNKELVLGWDVTLVERLFFDLDFSIR